MELPGLIALMGSGETSPAGGQVFETVASRLGNPLSIRILETPAGFELNTGRVASRIAEYLAVRLQNYQPEISQISARKRGTPYSPDSPDTLTDLLDAQMIFMGPGSPTYTVRQLMGSLAWDYLQTVHRLGAALVFASAATISIGRLALPVYEIYKVGDDPIWKPGLSFFKPFGLDLVFIPHWNNSEGGVELDTSRCFIGHERFQFLERQIPGSTTLVGLDEHTGIIIDPVNATCAVIGRSQLHLLRNGQEQTFEAGDQFELRLFGNFHMPVEPQEGIDPEVWQKVSNERRLLLAAKNQPFEAPPEVINLVALRQKARVNKEWKLADNLRERIASMGWKVVDTPQGPRVERA